MRAKLAALLGAGYGVRVVHPIAVDRWILQVDDVGTLLSRRRSPKHGALIDLVTELVELPRAPGAPRVRDRGPADRGGGVLRRHDPARCWRRRGWTVVERRLVEVIDRVTLADAADLRILLPADLPDRFTTADLASQSPRSAAVARQLAYCLRRVGIIEATGKRGHSVEYRLAAEAR